MDESTLRLRHPDSLGQAFLWALLPTLALVLIAPSLGDAQVQVTTSITSTPGAGNLATTITHAGDLYNITGGTRPGNGPNLFHSFGDFSVGGGDIANFLNNTQLPTSNILGRVTGGNISNIDGTIQTTGFGTANVFLVNPSGIVFGPHGSLDVGGSVSFSTAQYLRLFDSLNGVSANFHADPASDGLANSVLAVAPVVDFGFLSPAAYGFLTAPDPSATITVQGSMLQVPEGQALSLVSGDITIQSGTLDDGMIQAASLRAPGGQINLASVASAGEVQLSSFAGPTAGPILDGFTTLGNISLSQNASIDTSGTTGGSVVIRGGQLTIDNGRIIAEKTGNTSDSPAGIDIKIDGAFALNLSEQILALDTQTFGAGDGGDVIIAASKVILNFSGEEGFAPTVIAAGGNVVITATGDVNLNRVGVLNEPAAGPGNVGSIVIKGANVTVTNSFIGSEAQFTTHNPSALEIEATSSVKLIGPSFISSISGSGQLAGNVTITAKDLLMEGNAVITAHTQGAGNAGNIIIKADDLVMASESPLSPPSIRNDSIDGATGNAGSIDLSVGRLTMNPHSSITSVSAGGGNAGNVKVHGLGGKGTAANVITLDSSTISTEILGGSAASTPSAITITAHTLALANGAHIGAETNSAAPAGDIALNVGTLTAGNLSEISSSSSRFFDLAPAAGNAGNITIQGVTGPGSSATAVSLDNIMIGTTIAGGSSSTTPAAIEVTAQTVNLANGSQIKADTSGAAPAGNIALNVDTLTVSGDSLGFDLSGITSSSSWDAPTAGNAGSITIQGVTGSGSPAADVRLSGQIRTEIFGGSAATTPGAITITAQTLALANVAHIGADTVGAAPAGDIVLNVGTLTAGHGPSQSEISSSSCFCRGDSFLGSVEGGNAGNITIQGVTGSGSPATNVSLDHNMIITGMSGGTSTSTPATITITAHTLALADAVILAGARGAAPAGNITLNVGTLTVASDSDIDSSSNFNDTTAGKAGSITIQGVTGSGSPAAHVSLDYGAIGTTITGGTAATTPGAITITAHTLALANALIVASTISAAPAGNITLNVGTLTAGNSRIFSDSPFIDSTTGNAGSITIQGITGSGSPAAHVSLDNSIVNTTIVGGTSSSIPAAIEVTAQTVNLANGSQIKADTSGAAPAGNIALNVDTLTAKNSTISSSSAPAFIDEFEAFSEGGGDAGDISIQGVIGSGSPAANVSLDNSTISTTIAGGTLSNVPANITIAAHAVTLSNGADITASTTGNALAGNIGLVTQQLTMTPDSTITSNAQTGGTGTAGSITITGAGSAPTTIAGGTIQAQSETSASAGDITLHAPGDLTLLGTTISVKNTGPGSAGSINLRAGNDLLVRNSQVSTESAEASGGNITLTAPNLIHLVDSTLSSSVQGQAGSNGGNITIDPQFVVIQNSQLLANANAGAGGNITIAATGAVLIDPNSLLSASAGPAGVSGSVNIIAPFQVLGGVLVPLNLAYSQASLSGDRCAADPTGQFSSFVQIGRDGVPQVPGALSPSPLSFLETLTSGSLGSPGSNWAATRLGLDFVGDPSLFRFHSTCRS